MRDLTIELPALSMMPISWIAGSAVASEVISAYSRARASGPVPSASTRSTKVATIVSAVLMVESACAAIVRAVYDVTNLVCSMLAS